jgi:hypothetical protein
VVGRLACIRGGRAQPGAGSSKPAGGRVMQVGGRRGCGMGGWGVGQVGPVGGCGQGPLHGGAGQREAAPDGYFPDDTPDTPCPLAAWAWACPPMCVLARGRARRIFKGLMTLRPHADSSLFALARALDVRAEGLEQAAARPPTPKHHDAGLLGRVGVGRVGRREAGLGLRSVRGGRQGPLGAGAP